MTHVNVSHKTNRIGLTYAFYMWIDRETDGKRDRDRETDRDRQRQRDRQTERKTDRQKERQTDRETETERQRQINFNQMRPDIAPLSWQGTTHTKPNKL